MNVVNGDLGDVFAESRRAPMHDRGFKGHITLAPVPADARCPSGIVVSWSVKGRADDNGSGPRIFDGIVDALDEGLVIVLDALGQEIRSSGVVFVTGSSLHAAQRSRL